MKEKEFKEKEKDDGEAVLEYSHRESKKKRRIRSLLLLLFNILVIGIIIIIEVTSNREIKPIGDVARVWGQNWIYLLALVGVLVVNILALGLRYSAVIHALTGRKRLKLSFSTAVLGKYYDNITPFGTGGQPFQMFNLGRKLDVGLATSIPIANYLVNEFVSVIIQIVIFCTTYHVMDSYDFFEVAAYIGLVIFAFPPITILMFSIFPKTITKIARFVCKIGHKLHLIKDVEKAQQKAITGVQRYSDTLKLICKKWRTLIVMIVLSAVYNIAFNSIPFFVLKVCGIDADYVTTLSLSYYVYSAITIVPTPGGAGAAEGVFYAIFNPLKGPFMFWGILLWRLFVYYSTLIIGFSVTIYQYIHAARKEKRQRTLCTQAETGDLSLPKEHRSEQELESTEADGESRAGEAEAQIRDGKNDASPPSDFPYEGVTLQSGGTPNDAENNVPSIRADGEVSSGE